MSATGLCQAVYCSGLAGIACIFLGVFLLPMRRFTGFRRMHHRNRVILLAVPAALGTTGYSVIDDMALRLALVALG